jgi:hypothetical protein
MLLRGQWHVSSRVGEGRIAVMQEGTEVGKRLSVYLSVLVSIRARATRNIVCS